MTWQLLLGTAGLPSFGFLHMFKGCTQGFQNRKNCSVKKILNIVALISLLQYKLPSLAFVAYYFTILTMISSMLAEQQQLQFTICLHMMHSLTVFNVVYPCLAVLRVQYAITVVSCEKLIKLN